MADFSKSATKAPQPTYEEPQAGLLSNILAIVGFIILIVVVIWGLINLAGISSTWFSAFFGRGENVIRVTAPESASSGELFSLAWRYDEPTAGTYALLYPCQSNVQLQTPGPAGILNSIPCGAAFTIANMEGDVSLMARLSGESELEIPITVVFTPSLLAATTTAGESAPSQAQGSATVRIVPAETAALPSPEPAPTPTPTPTPAPAVTPTQAPATQAATPLRAPADLSVRIISVTTDGYGGGVAIFDIANVGGSASGSYYFTAQLPTISGTPYTSPTQSTLSPGSRIQSTLRFSNAASGIFSVSIVKADATQRNNYAAQAVASYYNSFNAAYPSYYGAQYSSVNYPYSPYQYQTYPNVYPTHQPYVQYSPYSTYYPYAY